MTALFTLPPDFTKPAHPQALPADSSLLTGEHLAAAFSQHFAQAQLAPTSPATTPAKPNGPLKILFAGTADFSAVFLQALLQTEHQIVAAVTQEDKVVGRGKKVQMTQVKEIALANQIPVYQFASSLRHPENYQVLLNELEWDLMVVVAFGDILPVELLHAAKYKAINVHPSLLPYGRGASPVQNTVAKGDKHTAFCIIKMEAGLDTGDILYWQHVPVDAKETTSSLFAKLSLVGAPVLKDVVNHIEYYLDQARPQDEFPAGVDPKKTYTKKIFKSYGLIRANFTANLFERRLRAYTPGPGIFFSHPNPQQAQDGAIVKVHQADAAANLEEFFGMLQSCKKPLQLADFSELPAPVENYFALLQNQAYPPTGESFNAELRQQVQAQASQFAQANPDFLAQVGQGLQGCVIATAKSAFYVLLNKGTVLEVKNLQLPGKNPVDIASFRNGNKDLFLLGDLVAPAPVK